MADTFSVLLVDDVAELRYLLRTVLEESGRFEIAGEAGDGRSAVNVAARTQPDLVLLDVGLPGMSGIEALPELQAAAPNAKVVMLSGYERERFWPEAAAGGAVAYLEKGIPPDLLVDNLLAAAGVLEVVQSAITQAHTRLAADLQSASTARRFIDETLRRWDCGETLEVVNLLVSELVTNAVIHAHSDVEVFVRMTGVKLRIDVLDHSDEPPVVRHASEYDVSGRGLALVESLSSAWGVEARPGGGKSVWFEVPALHASV